MWFRKNDLKQLLNVLKIYSNFIIPSSKNRETVIVYQMGKVGSKAIAKSLKDIGYKKNIYHMHFLSQDGINCWKKFEEMQYGGWNDVPLSSKLKLVQSHLLNKMLREGYLNRNNCKIITLVREPISRNISGFFEINYWWSPELKSQCSDRDRYSQQKSKYIQELTDCFFNKYWQHELPLTWLDTELKQVFGVDVFSSDFPRSKGYKIYKGEMADVLLLKLEKLNECVEDALREFLNLDNFVLKKENIGSAKWYSSIYKDFLNSVTIPDEYINKMYESRYSQHFYNEEEINKFKLKWSHERIDR